MTQKAKGLSKYHVLPLLFGRSSKNRDHSAKIIGHLYFLLINSLTLAQSYIMIFPISLKEKKMKTRTFISLFSIILLSSFVYADINEDLFKAVKKGDKKKIIVLIKKGADVNVKNKYSKKTALHMAAEKGHLEIVKLLIKKGANINARDDSKRSILYLAVKNEHRNIAKLLIQKGADIKAKDENGCSVLIQAVFREGMDSIARLLIHKGADINLQCNQQSVLLLALKVGNGNIAKFLIEKGAKLNSKDRFGRTPLHHALRKLRKEKIILLLIHKGADVNAKTTKPADGMDIGLTPLHMAALRGSIRIAEALIQKGADVNAKTKDDKTPLDLAKSNKMKKLLKKHGAKSGK
ncbi:MAG: hypothetical protein IEMM0008_1112 [bacterium]|nr:MAG: hypothetical protein IEMM0008_1112 [bacterium]